MQLFYDVNTCIYGCIWLCIPIYAPFWCPRGVQGHFIMHSQPGSWCTLHQSDTAMVQRYQTSQQRAVAPTQLPQHADKHKVKFPKIDKTSPIYQCALIA